MRRFRLFVLEDEAPFCTVSAIHEERGYRAVREALDRTRDVSLLEPDVAIVGVDLQGDRVLHLRHFPQKGVPLQQEDVEAVLEQRRGRWGHPVELAVGPRAQAPSGDTAPTRSACGPFAMALREPEAHAW